MSPLVAVHVAGGGLGIAAGALAVVARKGSPVHRVSGWAFTAAMTVAGLAASALAAVSPDWSNFPGGLLVAYLALTGWSTLCRAPGPARVAAEAGLMLGGAAAASALVLGVLAQGRPTLLTHGEPAGLFIAAGFAAFALALDLRARGGDDPGRGRLARHLWRMCAALFIATGSFFLGQQQVMPIWMRGSPVLVAAAIAPLLVMGVWLGRLALRRPPIATSARLA